jgi:phenylacetate-CoA ligase
MRAAESLPPAEQQRASARRSIEIARYAFQNTVFYRDRYSDAGFVERDFSEPANFVHLPLLRKDDVRAHAEELCATGIPRSRMLPSTTGGSTGRPQRTFQDRAVPNAALWWRAYRWWGVEPFDNVAFIIRQSHSAREQLIHDLQWWPTRQILLDARTMRAETMSAFAKRCSRVRPALISGYVDGVHEFASYCTRGGVVFPGLTAIAVTASVLTGAKRSFIQNVFGVPVFDAYRSAEVPWIAAECRERSGLHVYSDLRTVEILDDSGRSAEPGQQGELVVTDLVNRVFPLVRYRIGDRSSVRDDICACGMTLPLIDSIQGRTSDVLRGTGGRRITGGLSTLFNFDPDAVSQFQIHQSANDRVTLNYVPASGFSLASLNRAVTELTHLLGDGADVIAVEVSQIDHVAGKSRLVMIDDPDDATDAADATDDPNGPVADEPVDPVADD